jgi:molybdopterin-containing oxidoreductase family iron-sulfur binding subunit
MLCKSKKASGLELVLYTKTGMGGQQANNPWLQEFPIQLQEFLGIIMLQLSNADAKKRTV